MDATILGIDPLRGHESGSTTEFESANEFDDQSARSDTNSSQKSGTAAPVTGTTPPPRRSPLDAAVEERISKLSESLSRIFENFIGNAGGKEIPDPFSITISKETKGKKLWLPKNAEGALTTNAAMGILAYLWMQGGHEVGFSDKDVILQKLDGDSVKFWKAMMKELMRAEAPESLSFKGATDAERGTSAARAEFMKIYLTSIKKTHLLNYVSPALYTQVGQNTMEWFTVYLNKAGGITDATTKKSFATCLKQVISGIASERFSLWRESVECFKAPTSEAMKGLHRVKEVKEGRNKKMVPLHPNRPSERASVLFEWEKNYLKSIEGPFDLYKEIVADLQKESGVLLGQLESFRSQIKTCINDMWTVIQKSSAVLTAREKALAALVKEDSIGNGKATKENFKLFIANLKNHRLVGEDITNLVKRLKLFNLLREIASGTAEVVIADAARVSQVGNQLIIIVAPVGTETSIASAISEIARVLTATVSAELPRQSTSNRYGDEDDFTYDPVTGELRALDHT